MRLKFWRKAQGMTQADLARRVGLSNVQISHIERGAARPSLEAAKRIEAATGGEVKATELLGLTAMKGVRELPTAFQPEMDPIEEARALGLDPEAIAAKAVEEAVKRKRIEQWNEENREAIESWNEHYRQHGLWNEKYRLF